VCGIELFDDVAGRLDQLDEYRRCRKCGARWVARYQVLSVMLLDPQP
jgi:DNA-directed RNA polymerase subunit RPC12/RpoP